MSINVERTSVIFIYLSQLPHGADCPCSWSLRCSGHGGVGSHPRPPVTKHSHSTDKRGEGKMSAGQPILELLLSQQSGSNRWSQPIIISSSLSCLFPLTHMSVSFCVQHQNVYSPSSSYWIAASTELYLAVFIKESFQREPKEHI